jgi:hypothetical protein
VLPLSAEALEHALRDPAYRRRVADFLAMGLQLLLEAPEHTPQAPSKRIAEIMARLEGKRAAR